MTINKSEKKLKDDECERKKKVIELEKGKDDGEIGIVSSLASIRRQNAERIQEMGV
jgi:hypothetical protein